MQVKILTGGCKTRLSKVDDVEWENRKYEHASLSYVF